MNPTALIAAGGALGAVSAAVVTQGLAWWLRRGKDAVEIAGEREDIHVGETAAALNLGTLTDIAWRRVALLEQENVALKQQTIDAAGVQRTAITEYEARFGRDQLEIQGLRVQVAHAQAEIDKLRQENDEWKRAALGAYVLASTGRNALKEQVERHTQSQSDPTRDGGSS